MNSIDLTQTTSFNPLDSLSELNGLEKSLDDTSAQKLAARQNESVEIAKKFESILFNQMINEMKNTIGQWGEEKDGTSQQVQSLFWSQLGENLGEQGGIGLWQEIHRNLFNDTDLTTSTSALEESL